MAKHERKARRAINRAAHHRIKPYHWRFSGFPISLDTQLRIFRRSVLPDERRLFAAYRASGSLAARRPADGDGPPGTCPGGISKSQSFRGDSHPSRFDIMLPNCRAGEQAVCSGEKENRPRGRFSCSRRAPEAFPPGREPRYVCSRAYQSQSNLRRTKQEVWLASAAR